MAPGPGGNDTVVLAVEDPPTMKKAPKKIYIPIRIQTNALNNDDIAINAAYISIEDLPPRKKTKDVEIRYIDSIKSIRDKIKSTYSCNQDQCPMIKERLNQHQMEHHQVARELSHQVVRNMLDDQMGARSNHCSHHDRHSQIKLQPDHYIEVSKGTMHRVISTEPRVKKSEAISTTSSILKKTPNSGFMESQSIHTSPNIINSNHNTRKRFESHLIRSDPNQNEIPTYIDDEATLRSSISRDDLQDEIKKWFEDIPIYPNLTPSLKNLRTNMVNEFIDKILEIYNNDKVNYERKVNNEVEQFLKALPMWSPGAKRDQEALKDTIKNNLLEKIRTLREKSRRKKRTSVDDTAYTDGVVSFSDDPNINQIDSDREKIIESEVLEWLMQIKFKSTEDIGRTINIIDATDIFTKRLMPLLEKPSRSKNYKLILKGLIVDTLNDLPNVLHYPKNKRVYFNRIAEDLVNRLMNARIKYNRSFTCCFPKNNSMYQMAVCSKSSLKQSILDGLTDCLQRTSLDNHNDVKEEMTDILIDCLESVRLKDVEGKDELINNVLGTSFEILNTNTSDITIEDVKEKLTGDLVKNVGSLDNIKDASCHSGILSVFTSEHELPGKYPVTSTPKQKTPLKQDTQRLNEGEISYIEQVSLLIRNWMETLPTKFDEDENKNFKEVMISDLASDIMDQLKIEQLAPNENADRDQVMSYIVFRWLLRFDVYEDLNEAKPEVDNLVQRLHEIPEPNLTMPQKRNRQVMDNNKHKEGERDWKDDFVPQGIDVLQDEISIWMHEQPEEIYSRTDKDYQNKMIQELAGTVKNKIGDKNQENELDNDISKWLKIMLKSSEKKNIAVLAQDLKKRINKLPQDATLADIDGKRSNKRPVTVANSDALVNPTGQKEVNSTESETSQGPNLSRPCGTCMDERKTTRQVKDTKDSELNTNLDQKKVSKKGKKQLKKKAETSSRAICKCSSNIKKKKHGKTDSKHIEISGSDTSQESKLSEEKASATDDKSPKNKKSDKRQQRKGNDTIDRKDKKVDRKSKDKDKKMVAKDPPAPPCLCSKNKNGAKPIDSDTSQESIIIEKGTATNTQKYSTEYQSPDTDTTQDSVVSDQSENIGQTKPKSTCAKPTCPMKNKGQSSPDNDRTLIEYITKYMERNDVDDNIAKGAFEDILKTEFRKLTPPTRKEVYDKYSGTSHDEASPERLEKELQYIKDISDWLKHIPMDNSFNTPKNKERIEFVNDLAKSIYEIEEKRRNEPGTGYNAELASTIRQFTEKLPILPNYTENINFIVDQLVKKVVSSRTPMPCCMNATDTTMNSSGIPEQNISEFIENFIRLNAADIADDPLKLDAWSARILKKAKIIILDSAEPSSLYKTEVYNKLGNVSISEEDSIRIFGLELDYAKEISDWLNNLPLLPITNPEGSEQRVRMISELAEKFADIEKNKVINPDQTQSEDEMQEYLTNWINAIPLDPNREIVMPLVIQQLLNRLKRVNDGPQEPPVLQNSNQGLNMHKKSSKTKLKPKSSKSKTSCNSKANAGQLVVDAIENWSNNLPIKIKCKNAEKSIKESITRKLYQKVGDLSVDAQVMKDELLFKELLADEVNKTLDSLPQSPDIVKKKETLKSSLVDKVMEAKSLANESAAGGNYKQELENTIDASIPNPISAKQIHDPGFEIYKNRVTEMFIFENFDHGTDEAKLKYENMIKREIDKHHQDAQRMNALPLSKEQIYSELYGSLFKVPKPGESSTAEEVEEVKTRCEIADWFERLPLMEVTNDHELQDRDRIQSMLAKRIKEIERTQCKPDDKINKEITKWLRKLPLNNGNEENINELANDLQNKLKISKEDRKCVPIAPNGKDKKKSKSSTKRPSKTKGTMNTSQVAGPSSSGQTWSNPPSKECCPEISPPRKKAANVILEIVQQWCDSLPFYENTERSIAINRQIRDDIGTKIIIKLCELNGDPKVFSDEVLYDYLLDAELEKLMKNLPICCDFEPTKDYKKAQLKERINSVKPLMKAERDRYKYKKELNETVNNILKEPLDTTADKIALFNEIREEIVDDFVQYHYNRDDDEGKMLYKAKLRDAIMKYFQEMQQEDPPVDSLIKQNQLICELAKIPIPDERSIKEEVQVIRMKDEVKQFFEDNSITDESDDKKQAINNIQHSLAKRLNDIEKTGHNCTNDAIMKKEISRYLNKVDFHVDNDKIESFVDNLKNNEAVRKAPPLHNDSISSNRGFNKTGLNLEPCNCSMPIDQNDVQVPNDSFALKDHSSNPQGSNSKLCCPQAYEAIQTPSEYKGFGKGIALKSSPQSGQSQPASNIGTNMRTQGQRLSNIDNVRTENPTKTEGSGKRKQKKDREGIKGTGKECICFKGRERRNVKGRPRCVLRNSEFCDDCEKYGPMWMPIPPYRCPAGHFYF